ncbi:MAG: DoxX family protein [Gammaproteobacteria bacterium]|nr:DoxX family protein [Gammaproteobacteria bacterium]MDH5619411.1 DoxX family protein [Gammaproteobacteria bacterium]
MSALINLGNRIIDKLDPAGAWIALLPIRVLMAWEYGRAGLMKYNGTNWFANVQENFPFPFNVIPVEISWFLATWAEILGGLCLLLGLFTRFWAFSLIVLTIVAIAGVHWPAQWNSLAELWQGYSITDNGFGNYRIPLLFMAMLLPLVFVGGGKLSLDHILFQKPGRR